MQWKLPFSSFIVLTCSRSHLMNLWMCFLAWEISWLLQIPHSGASVENSSCCHRLIAPYPHENHYLHLNLPCIMSTQSLSWLLPSASILLDVRHEEIAWRLQWWGHSKCPCLSACNCFQDIGEQKSSSPWAVLQKLQINWFSDCFYFRLCVLSSSPMCIPFMLTSVMRLQCNWCGCVAGLSPSSWWLVP